MLCSSSLIVAGVRKMEKEKLSNTVKSRCFFFLASDDRSTLYLRDAAGISLENTAATNKTDKAEVQRPLSRQFREEAASLCQCVLCVSVGCWNANEAAFSATGHSHTN